MASLPGRVSILTSDSRPNPSMESTLSILECGVPLSTFTDSKALTPWSPRLLPDGGRPTDGPGKVPQNWPWWRP